MVEYLSVIKTLHLNGTQVIVSGGSSGIGRSIAIHYAALGASVVIVGRTRSAGEETLAEMERVGSPDAKARFKFIQSDLSLVSGMHQAAEDIREWNGEKGVQYFIQCQGIAPAATPTLTADGYEIYFATQVLSRFALPYLLFANGVLHPRSTVVHIAMPGYAGSSIPQVEDIDLAVADKTGGATLRFMKRLPNASSVIDCFTKELSLRHPQVRIVHMSPGMVDTGIITRSDNTLWWMRAVAHAANFVGLFTSPDTIAATVIYAASALPKDDEAFKAICLSEKVEPISLCPAAEDKHVREKVWVKLEEMIRARGISVPFEGQVGGC